MRESENLLTPQVIEKVIQSYEGDSFAVTPFTQSKYVSCYLGTFIDAHILPDKSKSKRYGKLKTCYADKSGTIKDKVKFCRRALEHIHSLDDISPGAKQLAKKIVDFIRKENQ